MYFFSHVSGLVRRAFGRKVIKLAKDRFPGAFSAEADLSAYVDHG